MIAAIRANPHGLPAAWPARVMDASTKAKPHSWPHTAAFAAIRHTPSEAACSGHKRFRRRTRARGVRKPAPDLPIKKRRAGDIQVPGSMQLVQGLIENELVDEIRAVA
jgi:hypothetical protein